MTLDVSALQDYWRGIAQQLQAEVDFVNSTIEHQASKGAGNELALRRGIAELLPDRFGVDTGIVIDRNGKQSKQCDIIIYDKHNYPGLLALRTTHLFPVDIVYAAIEVKTTLTTCEIDSSIDNIESVKSLDYIPRTVVYQSSKTTPGQERLAVSSIETTPPLGFVFAARSKARKLETIRDRCLAYSEEKRKGNQRFNVGYLPEMWGILDMGLIKFENLAPDRDEKPMCFTFPIMIDERTGARLGARDVSHKFVFYNNQKYPTVVVNGKALAVDQGRLLLAFHLLLFNCLNMKILAPDIDFATDYKALGDVFGY